MADTESALGDAGSGAAKGAATGAVAGPYGALIGGAIGAAGGILGNVLGSGDKQKQDAERAAQLAAIMGIPLPDAQALMVHLQQQQVQGQINPELEGTVSEGPSAYSNISTNPQLRDAQMKALSQLQQLGNTGLTATDRAALMQIQNQTSGQAQALNKSALANAAQRGMAGGGAELAARLIGSQGAANTGAQAGLNVAAQAQQKALQAMSNAGALGSQMEGQQFGEDAQKAAAADAISRFNTANRQNVMGTNTSAKNQAQYVNLKNAQDVANANAAILNQQAEHNANVPQQLFSDQLSRAGGAQGAFGAVANQYGTNAANTGNMWSGIGNAANSMLTAYGNSQKRTSGADQQPSPTGQGTNSGEFNGVYDSPQGPNLPDGNYYAPTAAKQNIGPVNEDYTF